MEVPDKNLYLNVADFNIELKFAPTEQVAAKRTFEKNVLDLWGRGGFLVEKPKKINFRIKISSFPALIDAIGTKKGKRQYFLSFNWGKRSLETYYHVSLPLIQIALKRILDNLLKNSGFILHASSVIDQRGRIYVFLAPREGGKSTVADLLCKKKKDFEKFGDDNLLVRKMGNNWMFFSPPFIEKDHWPINRQAKNATFFFIKKASRASKKIIQNTNALPKVLKQIWQTELGIDKKTFIKVLQLVSKNKFYSLETSLNASELKRVIYEN